MSANILIGQSKPFNQTQSQGAEIYAPLPKLIHTVWDLQ